tara:strand:- start:625 stop:963 length:339 start_codon:yes stop_codon:yes gene_type:complete
MKIGSFVECIDDKFSSAQLEKLSKIPKEGDYYTIREIIDYPNLGRTGVKLEEISNPLIEMNGSMGEPTFNIFRFRELEIPPPMELEIREALDNDLDLEIIEEDDGLLRRIRN